MKRKGTNKIMVAFLLSMLMVLSMGLSVFAEGELKRTIAIDNAREESEYSVYQVFTSTINGDKNLYSFDVAPDFAAFFNGEYGYTLSPNKEILNKDGDPIITDNRWDNVNNTEAAALASALEKYALSQNIQKRVLTKENPSAELPIGYYVVAETKSADGKAEVASKPILVNLTEDDVNITLKHDTTKLDKVIVGDDDGKSNNVNIGDKIEYKITTRIPSYEANVDKTKLKFKLTDIFSKGLTYNKDVIVTVEGVESPVYMVDDSEDQKLIIEFAPDQILDYQGLEVVATYTATLNKDAEVDSKIGNPNNVTLEYSNNTNEENAYDTLDDKTITYTYGFNVHKVDQAEPSKSLANAEFELFDEDNNQIFFTKSDDGTYTVTDKTEGENVTKTIVSKGGEDISEGGLATVKGLEEGTYKLRETKAPDDFTKLAEDVVVVITAIRDQKNNETGEAKLTASGAGNAMAEVYDDEGRKTGEVTSSGDTININVYIENAKGISLPETGRNSALYCMIGGAALIIFGGLYYILSARRRREY